jgi:hypothetical protein
LNEINSNYSDVLLHTSVRWLSRGKVIERFFSLRQEIILFLHENNQVYHELENDEWCSLLAFLCDITEKLSELNRGRKHCLDFSLITAQFRAIIGVRNARHCWTTAVTQGHLFFGAKQLIKKKIGDGATPG